MVPKQDPYRLFLHTLYLSQKMSVEVDVDFEMRKKGALVTVSMSGKKDILFPAKTLVKALQNVNKFLESQLKENTK